MASSVAHMIGFSSLLILTLVSVQLVQDMQVLNIQRTARTLAMEVSHRVSRDIMNMVNIASRTRSENMLLIKELDIPDVILERGYKIELKAEGDFYKVQVKIIDWSWLEPSTSELPINASSTAITIELGEGTLPFREYTIHYSNTILSGVSHPVIWVVKEAGTVRVGIGVMES